MIFSRRITPLSLIKHTCSVSSHSMSGHSFCWFHMCCFIFVLSPGHVFSSRAFSGPHFQHSNCARAILKWCRLSNRAQHTCGLTVDRMCREDIKLMTCNFYSYDLSSFRLIKASYMNTACYAGRCSSNNQSATFHTTLQWKHSWRHSRLSTH